MQSPSRSPKQKRHRTSPVFEPSDNEPNMFPDSDFDISLASEANDSLSQTSFSDTKEDSGLWSDSDMDGLRSPRSIATRFAKEIAEIFRGCVTKMLVPNPCPCSKRSSARFL